LPFLNFTVTDPYNDNFNNMGYGDMNSVNNMGTMFFGFVIYSLVLPMLPVFYLLGKKAKM
jgi:hypothetical protein